MECIKVVRVRSGLKQKRSLPVSFSTYLIGLQNRFPHHFTLETY